MAETDENSPSPLRKAVEKPGDSKIIYHPLSDKYRWEVMLDDSTVQHGWTDFKYQAEQFIDMALRRQHWKIDMSADHSQAWWTNYRYTDLRKLLASATASVLRTRAGQYGIKVSVSEEDLNDPATRKAVIDQILESAAASLNSSTRKG